MEAAWRACVETVVERTALMLEAGMTPAEPSRLTGGRVLPGVAYAALQAGCILRGTRPVAVVSAAPGWLQRHHR